MHPLAEAARRSHRQAGFFLCLLPTGLARLDLASGELLGERLFRHAPSDHQEQAVIDENSRCDRGGSSDPGSLIAPLPQLWIRRQGRGLRRPRRLRSL